MLLFFSFLLQFLLVIFSGRNFFWVKKICVEKKFGTKKHWIGNWVGIFLGKKNLHRKFWSKKFGGKKKLKVGFFWVSKNIWVGIFVGSKKMWSEIFLGQKKYGSEIFLGQKKFGSEIFLALQKFGWKFVWLKKNLCRKKFWAKKRFESEIWFGQILFWSFKICLCYVAGYC